VVESGGTYSRNRLDRLSQKKDFHDPHERNVAMRARAYRPEVPVCLEDRSLLSGVAGPSADPVILSRLRLRFIVAHIQDGFSLFARNRDVSQLHSEIDDVVMLIPFGRVDGVRASINRVVTRMQNDFRDQVPRAFLQARLGVNAVIRADVEARIRAGDLVVR
jgi:hypothetical protein